MSSLYSGLCRTLFVPLAVSLLALSLTLPTGAQKPPDLLKQTLEGAKWRSIGPSAMGGRISDIAVDPKNPFVFYVGLATGGLIKTTNDGTTWTPLFDKQPVASIGSVAVAPTDSKIVWVGTGEANGRNSSSWGNGVYKSTDGGATWTNMGLKETQEIGQIAIDPKDANTVWVAAAGKLWGKNRERGVYKTTDGGKTWKHSLAINDETGAIDLDFGADGNTVFAATYHRRRYPWGFQGQSTDSALYKTSDGGKTWKKLTNGLPAGALGRIGVNVCRSKPSIVYTVIESQTGGSDSLFDTKSKYGGVFRSDDAGETWRRVNPVSPRGFYFGKIRVDPSNPDQVYVLGFDLSVSSDGGKTFKESSSGVHSDLHALWIDPQRPDRLLLGTDGGLYTSLDKAKTWRFIGNFPMGEFYEVSLDNRNPYWVYGGLQDNGSWGGPSALRSISGPDNSHWVFLNGGDGFYVLTDPADPNIVYAESQGAGAARIDRNTNMRKNLSASAPEGEQAYRFNWNSPMALNPFDRDNFYIGGNRLFKWTKKGTEWAAISPDLTKQHGERITASGSGAETYGTIVSLALSPLTRGIIWTGTDDGNVQVTQDEGKTWVNLTNSLPERVRDFYVKRIETSHFVAGRAYVAIDGHRSDNFEPYLFVTDDFGKSWKSIVSDLPEHGPVKAIREDPTNPELLFVGTEFGCFMSLNRGGKWYKLDSGLPTVAVDDLAIHPRDHALVAATHGRSFWIIDNIIPLQEMSPKVLASEVHLFSIAPKEEFIPVYNDWFGGAEYKAPNPPSGVEIVYWMKNLAEENPKVVITDSANKEVATLSGERYPGLVRLYWDMRGKPDENDRRRRPKFVKPGVYTVTLTVGKVKQTQKVTVSGSTVLSDSNSDEDNTEKE